MLFRRLPKGVAAKIFDRYIMIGFETKALRLPELDFGKVEAWLGEVAARLMGSESGM